MDFIWILFVLRQKCFFLRPNTRDSSRVGASLSFDGTLNNGEWYHCGLSSKGDSTYEVWLRVK